MANPASLIRQARKSLVASQEEMKMAPRHRRVSAPPTYDTPSVAFKARCKATIRTLPSNVSMKLGDLPEAWKVVESQKESGCPGWIAIEPRGYVRAEDLVPASPLRSQEAAEPQELMGEDMPRAPRSARLSAPDAPLRSARRSAVEVPRSARGSLVATAEKPARVAGSGGTPPSTAHPPARAPRSSLQSPRAPVAGHSPRLARAGGGGRAAAVTSPSSGLQARTSPRACAARRSPYTTPSPGHLEEHQEVIALKEEQVHLRESNVGLREKELDKRRELEELNHARTAMMEEVARLERSRIELQEQQEAEQRELEKQQEVMKEKLERCRDAVAFAVGSIDELYSQQDQADRRTSICQPDEAANTNTSMTSGHGSSDSNAGIEDLHNAKALAQEAGAEVCELLNKWDQAQGIHQDEENLCIMAPANKDKDITASEGLRAREVLRPLNA